LNNKKKNKYVEIGNGDGRDVRRVKKNEVNSNVLVLLKASCPAPLPAHVHKLKKQTLFCALPAP